MIFQYHIYINTIIAYSTRNLFFSLLGFSFLNCILNFIHI